MNRSIVFTSPGIAELQTLPMPAPGPGEALVRISYSAISSGTERANLIGDENLGIYEAARPCTYPRTLGYSSSGTIEALGEGVTGFSVGDRVALSWSKHTLHQTIPVSNLTKLTDGVSLQDAALWHIGTFPLAAIRKCRLEVGEAAVVMGQGILGAFAVRLLKACGAVPIIAVDPVESKRVKALENGADYALDPFAPGFADEVKRLAGGGVPVAIEVTGNGTALDQVLDCMAPRGRIALLGCTRHSDFTIDYYRKVHGPGIQLLGAHTMARPVMESSPGMWTCHDDMITEQKLTLFGRLSLSSMVEEIHTPEEAGRVYERLALEKAFPLVLFDWTKYPD